LLDDKRKRKYPLREIFNALFYINKTGCQWRWLPKDYPPFRLVHYYFRQWSQGGLFQRLNQALNRLYREKVGRKPSPSLGLLDAQSVKKSEWGLPNKGFDGYKHIKGMKRQLVVDTLGLILAVFVHPANEYDGNAARSVLEILARQGYE
jgi:putative transposase